MVVVRAARHGHQMNGKLARLAQQEASLLQSDISTAAFSQQDNQRMSSETEKKKKKRFRKKHS